jgi:hypothetical protein
MLKKQRSEKTTSIPITNLNFIYLLLGVQSHYILNLGEF